MIDRLGRTVGESGFPDALLNSLDGSLTISDCVVFQVRHGKLLSALEVSQSDSSQLSSLIARYLRHFPDQGRRIGSREVRVPYHKVKCNAIVDIDGVETSRFRRNFYDEGNFVDQVWSTTRHPGGFIGLCAFRRGVHGKFKEDEIERFAQLAPVFMPLVSRHVSMYSDLGATGSTLPLERARMVIAATGATLAPKEAEVCARILRGMTSEAIALDLNSSIHTIRTYRKRAYKKMRITSVAELFSRAVAAEQLAAARGMNLP